MNKKRIALFLVSVMTVGSLMACGAKGNEAAGEGSSVDIVAEQNVTSPSEEPGESELPGEATPAETAPNLETAAPSPEATAPSLDLSNAQLLLNAPIETKTENGSNYSIITSYPVFGIANLDAGIQAVMNNEIAEFKQSAGETESSELDSFILNAQAELFAYETRFISVKIFGDWDLGGAHPGPYLHTVCFDLQNDKVLALQDLFKADSNYLEQISGLCRKTILAERPDLEGILYEEGLLPEEANFSNFVLTDEGILFFFPPYQLAPYAAGEQSAVIPYDQLPEGFLG